MDPAFGLSLIALIISGFSIYWCRKVSMLSADDNIVRYVSIILTLLEKVKQLDIKEKELVKKLLIDADFFGATNAKILHDFALNKWPVDTDLEEYFKSL
jgi:hypothetical protein